MRLLVCALAVAAVVAQVPHPFRHYTPVWNQQVSSAKIAMAEMDIPALIEKANELNNLTKIFEFGQINPMQIDFLETAERTKMTGGTLYSMTFNMDNALSMAFFFSKFDLPEGGALFLVSETETAGPWTHLNKWDTGAFQTRHVKGNTVSVQYFQAVGTKGKATIELAGVTTAFRGPETFAGACNINTVCNNPINRCRAGCIPTSRTCSVACTWEEQNPNGVQWADQSWDPQIRATIALARNQNSRYCSGAFIDNYQGNQYVLTAAHCGPGANDLVQIGFINPDCMSTSDTIGERSWVAGNIRTLARDTRIDNQLIEIGETIPPAWNVFLAGWDASDQHNPASYVVGIHHPAGANKKISHSDETVTPHSWSGGGAQDHWRVATWSEATTEPGSSGSPLFSRATKRIIGQLHGGSAACPARNGWDSYGAVWAGYAATGAGGMRIHLNPDATSMDGRPLY